MKTIIITGANSGLGFETAKKIAKNKEYEVILACRNKERAENAKIYNVSSDMHNPPGGIEWKDIEKLAHPKDDARSKYSYSKLFNIYFTYELDKRLRRINSKISVNAFNPGYMSATNFIKGNGNKLSDTIVKMMGRMGDLDMSSTALAELVGDNDFNNITGKYFDRSTKFINSSELSYNEEHMLELWNKSVEYTNLSEDETIKGIMD